VDLFKFCFECALRNGEAAFTNLLQIVAAMELGVVESAFTTIRPPI
jgi:hypothetical protein